MSTRHDYGVPMLGDNILADRCQCRLNAARIEQLERELAREKAAREKAEAQLLEKQQGGMRYARNT